MKNCIYAFPKLYNHISCIFIYYKRWLMIIIKIFLYYLINTFVFTAIPNDNQFVCLS